MPPPPPLPQPTPQAFTVEANRFLHDLSLENSAYLSAGNDLGVLQSTRIASTIRRATVVYVAASDILPAIALRESERLARDTAYLRGLVERLWNALRSRDVPALETLGDAAQVVLDAFQEGEAGLFEELQVIPLSLGGTEVGLGVSRRRVEVVAGGTGGNAWSAEDDPQDPDPDPDQELQEELPTKPKRGISIMGRKRSTTIPTAAAVSAAQEASNKKGRGSCCGLSCSDLGPRDKLILWLYLVMVLGAVIAVTAVTVDFVQQQITPGSFLRAKVTDNLAAPVVTVCLSQRGVPRSRLQLFNFTNAEGINVRGADPNGRQTDRQSPEFAAAVDRFWDNPDNEDCDKKVGDFFPFPLRSLNQLTSGEATTKCRPCYRVGRKQLAIARSTDFQNSSVLEFYTDNYFLQCMKSLNGLNPESLEFLHAQVDRNKTEMESLGVLSSAVDGVQVTDLKLEQFQEITEEQACNIFYFGFFPKALGTGTGEVDISYAWNGTKWNPKEGTGPYFKIRTAKDFLPEESLQMFVGTNKTTREEEIGDDRDMVLIGPNTQTFANFRPVVVYDIDRYDISSSTSNLMTNDVAAIFGYWLVYRIYYNFNRFVTEEVYRESTYPASQWIVDLTGYASLFTGASLFSLFLLPLLRAMRKREKQRLIKQKPEVYLWSQHKQRYQGAGGGVGKNASTPNIDLVENGNLMRGSSVMLPGYNV